MSEHNIISVSGGKDSTALLLLAIERQPDNMQAVFADTGHEHAQTYDYVHYLAEVTGVPIRWVKADYTDQIEKRRQMMQRVIDGTHKNQGRYEWTPEIAAMALEHLHPTGNPFLDMCLVHGRFPSTKVRFCSEELKRDVITNQVMKPLWAAGDCVVSWQGVRADESPKRALLDEEEDINQQYTIFRPILHWTADQCFDMHRKHGIKHNPLYEQGMGRVGCMPCIHARKDELLEISKRFPEEVARISEWERLVSKVSNTGNATFFAASDLGAKTAMEANSVGTILHFVEWAKTSHGGKQYDFIRMQDDGPLCTSIYGLCE